MKSTTQLRRFVSIGAVLAAGLAFSAVAKAAGPEVVAGPAQNLIASRLGRPTRSFSSFQRRRRPIPHCACNGYIANTWRFK